MKSITLIYCHNILHFYIRVSARLPLLVATQLLGLRPKQIGAVFVGCSGRCKAQQFLNILSDAHGTQDVEEDK